MAMTNNREHLGTHPVTETTCDYGRCWCQPQMVDLGSLHFHKSRTLPFYLTVSGPNGETVVRIGSDGTLELCGSMTATDQAKAFWDAVQPLMQSWRYRAPR